MDLDSLAIKVSRSENLPVLPQIVSSVMKLADDPDASARSMERIIERDPAIAAKILRVANSSLYGVSQIPSIARAISVLGLNSIRSLVIGVAYQQIIAGREQAKSFNKLDFWKHSLAVATAARIIAKIKLPAKAEELYLAGMMHDVGMLVLDRFCPNEFDQALQYARQERIPIYQAERRLFGFDHADVGGLLAEKWGLTPLMTGAVRYHHSVIQDGNHGETTAMVAAANYLASAAGMPNN
ncbi:MAG TPA: HDOD domain-containing protein, partial [Fimbriimonadaceae bacterium]|nr:HDOD domain-containing protein [Fimbriimonadaceae bacterium]